MDITETLAPNSDQLDAIELVGGDRTFTVKSVTVKQGEQPVDVFFTDFPRPWRPAKNMRRVLGACWGNDASQWTGRRVTLFYDPDVKFGKETPGGTRIRALSHIGTVKKVSVLEGRGKSGVVTVQPLPDAPPQPASPTPDQVAASTNVTELQAWIGQTSNPRAKAAIQARIDALTPADDVLVDAFPEENRA